MSAYHPETPATSTHAVFAMVQFHREKNDSDKTVDGHSSATSLPRSLHRKTGLLQTSWQRSRETAHDNKVSGRRNSLTEHERQDRAHQISRTTIGRYKSRFPRLLMAHNKTNFNQQREMAEYNADQSMRCISGVQPTIVGVPFRCMMCMYLTLNDLLFTSKCSS